MTKHRTGTREEWLAERLELLDAEKELSRRSDEVARVIELFRQNYERAASVRR